ncbi:pre-mRNA-splicing factor CWC22 homolog [Pecten maximus]|uniref:pre-mRNA-splicing factor CWC22 homolog n=1 Tax=Pecten maximus TaxID=6579 RepID=UPI001458E7DF|nr:pre-mRNA-splicing factor CWC22 homolog [Pecten maximus]
MRPDSSMFSDLVRGARQGMETGSPGAKCKPNEDKGYSWERTGWTFDSKLRPSHTEPSKTTRLFNKDCLLKDSSLSSGESSVADLERRLSNLRMSTDNLIFNQTKQEPPSKSDRSLKQEPLSASLFKSAEEIKRQLIEQHAQQLELILRLEHAASGSLSRTTKRSCRSLKQEDVNKEKGHTDLSARPSRSINKGKSDVKPTLSISRMSMESGMQGQTDRCSTSASVDTRSPSHTRSLKGHKGDRYSRHRRQSPRTTTSHGKSEIQDSRTRKGSRDSRSSRSEFKVTRAKGSRSDKQQRSRSRSSSSSSPEGRYLSDKSQHKKHKSFKSRYQKVSAGEKSQNYTLVLRRIPPTAVLRKEVWSGFLNREGVTQQSYPKT